MADLRAELAQDFPLMRVHFIVRNKNEIKDGIVSGNIHFGIVNIHESQAIHSLNATFLGHVEFVPFVKKGGRLSEISAQEAFSVLASERQFILRTFVEENLTQKIVFSSEHEEVDQLALAIKLVGEDLGWALLPKILSESEYATDRIQEIQLDQMLQGLKFGVALWSPHSKQIIDVRKSIITVLNRYVNKIRNQYK